MTLQPGCRPVPNCPDYVLVRKLGAGAFGEVWHARGPGGLDAALKFIRLDPHVRALELRSLEMMKSIRHPNLVSLFGAWHKDGWLILAMELCDRSLQDRLREASNQSVPGIANAIERRDWDALVNEVRAPTLPGIPVKELLEYMRDAASGLDVLNGKQVQHRDVKPANLLLLNSGVKVADFGLAKALEQSVASNSGAGTLAYTAPECFKGLLAQQSDQYSLAVTYYHLRTGHLLFKGDQAQVMYAHLELEPDLAQLPRAERVVLARALSKEPGKRWPNCKAFVDELIGTANPPVTRGVADRPQDGLPKAREAIRFVRRVFEQEIPEIRDRTIEIKAIAREAGYCTKIAVSSIDMKVDCVGACVGVRGSRIKNIVDELSGERIDIVRWNDSLQVLIPNALQPARIEELFLYPRLDRAIVMVKEDQMCAAIGRRGQNVRLASELVGWDIEIMTQEGYCEEIEKAVGWFSEIPGLADEAVEALIEEGFLAYDDLTLLEPAQLAGLAGVTEDQAEEILAFAEEAAERVRKETRLARQAGGEARAAAEAARQAAPRPVNQPQGSAGLVPAEERAAAAELQRSPLVSRGLEDLGQGRLLKVTETTDVKRRGRLVRVGQVPAHKVLLDVFTLIRGQIHKHARFSQDRLARMLGGWTKEGSDQAIRELGEAIRLDPRFVDAYNSRGLAWYLNKDYDQAIKDFSEAIRLDPSFAFTYVKRGDAWSGKKDYDRAIKDYDEAIRLNPRNVFYRGRAWSANRGYGQAIKDYSEAIRLDPGDSLAYYHFAWLLATCPDENVRDGKRAIQIATKSVELGCWAWQLDALAAAYAEAGLFDEAARYQTKALEGPFWLPEGTPWEPDRDAFLRRLDLYKQKKPYRENP